jgi:8-oxo-dGTP pyrophosphatase MutT (NUDIX family)
MADKVWGLAAYAVLQKSEGKLLLLRRSADSKTNPGRWEPRGGKMEPGERLDEALKREVFEETGLLAANISKPAIYFRFNEQNLQEQCASVLFQLLIF